MEDTGSSVVVVKRGMLLPSCTLAAVLLLASTFLSGCTSPLLGGQPEPLPLEVVGLHIGQEQRAGPTPVLYMGSLTFPICIRNPNPFSVLIEDGYEVYQVLGPPEEGERRLVQSYRRDPAHLGSEFQSVPVGMNHAILYNETLEGKDTKYVIHLWHQILDPGPIHRYDRWFNVTFVPYTSATYHSEGERC